MGKIMEKRYYMLKEGSRYHERYPIYFNVWNNDAYTLIEWPDIEIRTCPNHDRLPITTIPLG